jgi:preprotein translocase subunit SecD
VAAASATPAGRVYTTIIDGSDLDDAFITQNQVGARVVGFRLKGDAADRFYQFTSDNIGRPMSILVDKTVISSPSINGPISGEGIIEGMGAQEVQDLVVQLKAGALNVPLEVVSNNQVGPTLGQDSIDRSLIAGIVGLGTVALFMILYYRLPGLLSVVALLIYTALTLSIFKLMGVTLTLAGIAGFILSIGMAVDANVLIFARLKEELRVGRTLDRAVEAAFTNAFPSIRDSNVSTLITCVILYFFGNRTGTSIITGFAITLGIGVVVSFFSAVFVSRNFMRMLVLSGVIRDTWWYGIDHAEKRAMGSAGD